MATNHEDLAEVSAAPAMADERASAARAAFRARFCYLDDGAAAERIVRRVLLHEEQTKEA